MDDMYLWMGRHEAWHVKNASTVVHDKEYRRFFVTLMKASHGLSASSAGGTVPHVVTFINKRIIIIIAIIMYCTIISPTYLQIWLGLGERFWWGNLGAARTVQLLCLCRCDSAHHGPFHIPEKCTVTAVCIGSSQPATNRTYVPVRVGGLATGSFNSPRSPPRHYSPLTLQCSTPRVLRGSHAVINHILLNSPLLPCHPPPPAAINSQAPVGRESLRAV